MADFEQTFPGGANFGNPNTLRINISCARALKQNLNPKDPRHIQTGEDQMSWSMIAPSDIQELVTHTFDPYDSIQGRAAQALAAGKKSAAKVVDVAKNGLFTSDGNISNAKTIVDSPLVYAGSERRVYSFTFILMIHNDAFNDVLYPIQMFRRYSCATIEDAQWDTVEFPSVFTLQTWPNTFINIPHAILTNVQTTYQAPYVAGIPHRAEITLTFKDLKPLYRSSFDMVAAGKTTVEVVL